jgi:hypothetical protein
MRTVNKAISNNRKLKQTQILTVFLVALALLASFQSRFAATAESTTTESTIVLETADAPFLQGAFQVVNNQLGNGTNPHVSCNFVSYTFDDLQGSSTVRYHDLVTGTESVIPGNAVDLLSDISGSRVAFTEVTFSGDTVRIFDTNSQVTTIVPGLGRSNPSIGGNLVAFEDRVHPHLNIRQSEILTYDLSTGTFTPLTQDTMTNMFPSVSPNGDAVVWEKCIIHEVGCDIYAAIQTSPGLFTSTVALTLGGGNDRLPSTNGQVAVYVSDRTGENDIYYQPLAGGSEVHLEIPGNQRWARISGDLISFESQGQSDYDIFVYDIRTEKLFQVSDTPLVDETLTDISVCNGVGRIVYSIPGDGAFDVYAFSFQVPSVPEDQIDDLIALIPSFNLPPGTANSLTAKLREALTAIDSGDLATACSSLTAFTNECAAQSGKKLTPDQATQLINSANQIKAGLGCQ